MGTVGAGHHQKTNPDEYQVSSRKAVHIGLSHLYLALCTDACSLSSHHNCCVLEISEGMFL